MRGKIGQHWKFELHKRLRTGWLAKPGCAWLSQSVSPRHLAICQPNYRNVTTLLQATRASWHHWTEQAACEWQAAVLSATDELPIGKVWKEAAVALLKHYPCISRQDWDKSRKFLFRMDGVLAQIRTMHFPNTSKECYRCTSILLFTSISPWDVQGGEWHEIR